MDRFYSKVDIDFQTGCHLWTAGLNQAGYGRILINGKNRHAHRVAWELVNGPIPSGKWILHACDNPRCVNPDHLFLGDASANSADKVAKGRQAFNRGEAGGNAILTNDQVLEIRKTPRQIDYQRYFARIYGVSVETIKAIQYGRSWRHI